MDIRPKNSQIEEIEQSTQRPAYSTQPLRTVAFLIVVLWGVSSARPFLQPLCIAALLAFLMGPLHRFFKNRLKFPDAIATLVSAVLLLSPIVLIGYLLVRQGQSLVEDFPHLVQAGQGEWARISQHPFLHRFGADRIDTSQIFSKLSSGAGQGLGILVGGLAALASIGSQGLLIFVFSILMLGSRVHLRKASERILEQSPSLREGELLNQVVDLIQRFLVARMTIVLIIGALATAVFAAFSIKYAIFLGGFMGVMTLVPAIGFLASLIPALIVAAVTGHSFPGVLGLAGALVVVNCVDNYYLTPKMVGNRLNLNALVTFVGLFAGGLLWGVWGMLLSVPALGVIRIAFSAVPRLQPWGELMADKVKNESPRIRLRRPKAHPEAA